MKSKVYLETTIISYLAARPSRDLIVAAHQQLTEDWWESRRHHYDLFVSELVIREAGIGDKGAAQKRIATLESITVLKLAEDALYLAMELLRRGLMPERATEDALHIASAAVHGMDFLLTWNCRHIANAEIRAGVTSICFTRGYEAPVICTPEELMGE